SARGYLSAESAPSGRRTFSRRTRAHRTGSDGGGPRRARRWRRNAPNYFLADTAPGPATPPQSRRASSWSPVANIRPEKPADAEFSGRVETARSARGGQISELDYGQTGSTVAGPCDERRRREGIPAGCMTSDSSSKPARPSPGPARTVR